MTSTLRFEIQTEEVPERNRLSGPYVLVHVVPVIDADPYIEKFKDYPFEALEVYGFGLISGEIWPFNCECGTPGCARINEPTLMTVDGTSVRWEFPEEPYDYLANTKDGHSKPREFVFDRQQYVKVFEDLVVELKGLEARHGKIGIAPVPPRILSVDQTVEVRRNFAEFRRIRRAALGDLDHEHMLFVVTSEDGLELTMQISDVVFKLTWDHCPEEPYDLAKVQEVLERLGQQLRVTPESVLKQMGIHDLSASLRVAPTPAGSYGEDDDASEENWPAPYWTDADSPSEHLEFWRELQRSGKVTIRPRGY
ncbi:hypothetical protein [Acidovorax sp. Root219]|uniref:hypothetical protein n=1 Tax=Acidovorax sp. Root219 TaxID=1736493 RepID=UPI000ADD1821|nr:hypothetical protein [Acidovorax sp. Root219]